jgi:hypothetical protein
VPFFYSNNNYKIKSRNVVAIIAMVIAEIVVVVIIKMVTKIVEIIGRLY